MCPTALYILIQLPKTQKNAKMWLTKILNFRQKRVGENLFETMKKVLCFTIIMLVLFASAVYSVAPCVALADDDIQHVSSYTPLHKRYTLNTLLDESGKPVGVSFYGFYFGASDIAVQVELYSSPQLELNFYIGDRDYGDTADSLVNVLTAEQTETKRKVIELCEQIDSIINKVDVCANTQYDGSGNLPTSDIYRYNNATQGTTLNIAQETYEMLQIAQEMYLDTNGAFNPAVYRLVDLWGFSSRIYSNGNFGLPYDRVVTGEQFYNDGYPLPGEKYVRAFSDSKFIDFSSASVTLSNSDGNYYVTKNVAPVVVDDVAYEQWLDLGGIAKGYVVDSIKQLLQSNNLFGYYIDAGSSSSALGDAVDGGKITLSLADPFDSAAAILPKALLSFKAGRSSVSTSGQYIRKYTTNGVEYSHIIDGAVGAPAQTGVKSVMVVIPESEGLWAGKGDCLTTALTVMGREKVAEFVNGYLKQHGIIVVMLYETLNGGKQIVSNLDKSEIIYKGDSFEQFGWALTLNEKGEYQYDANAVGTVNGGKTNNFNVITIVLGVLFGVAVIALVVYHLVKGKTKALQKVQYARTDKPFKIADLGVYFLVIFLIVVLFAAFFGVRGKGWSVVEVVDITSGEQLFLYNVARNDYIVNDDNSNGWQIQVQRESYGLSVTFSKEIDGETHFNTVRIERGAVPMVKMQDSLCGFHQECVHNFGEVKVVGGAIVCSPNRLKVITK